MKRLGHYLKRLRKQQKLTLMEVRKLTGISIGYLSELEGGGKGIPHPDILNKLGKVYGVQLEELMKVAGYSFIFTEEDDVEWAIAAILRDMTFAPYIDKGRIKYMPLEMKIKLIRTYESMTGRKLLSRKQK